MHTAFERIEHRPWKLPQGPWSWRQSWCELLFAHWPVPKQLLEPLVPKELEVQEFDSTSWVGVVPFRMQGVMRRPLPDLPWISAFPELNLRLYVEKDGMPGVWFLSLDATNWLAVWAARRFFSLPYFRAEISMTQEDEDFHYESHRIERETEVKFKARYRPTSEIYEAKRGSLEHWLTERYCLYARSPKGELYRTEVHHHPWSLQQADANIMVNELGEPHGLELKGQPSLLHYSKNIDVVVWNPVKLAS